MATTTNKKAKTITQPLIVSESFIDVDSHEELTTTNNTLIVSPFKPESEVDEVTELNKMIESLKEQIKTKQKRIRELTKPASTKKQNKKRLAIEWLNEHKEATLKDFINYAMDTLQLGPVYCNTLYKCWNKA